MIIELPQALTSDNVYSDTLKKLSNYYSVERKDEPISLSFVNTVSLVVISFIGIIC